MTSSKRTSHIGSYGSRILLFLSILLHSLSANSQVLKSHDENAWVSQRKNPTNSNYHNTKYIGNYSLLDINSSSVQHYLKTISSNRSGTLFLVIKPKVDSLSDNQLLKLGSLHLYKDSVYVDGNSISINPIGGEATIIRVKYQGQVKRNWLSRSYRISNEIDLAELIYYNNVLSDSTSRIVESLLAIKYSINITKNSDPDFRDYLSIYNGKLWDAKVDELYDKSVFGLGRMDRVGFYQSQTLTANSSDIKLSLDSLYNVNEMPVTSIEDSALIIVSKGNETLRPKCGGSPYESIFKLKMYNWVSKAQYLFIEIDTVLDLNNIKLYDGKSTQAVIKRRLNSKTILKIPITNLQSNRPYYIIGKIPSDTCNKLSALRVMNCDSNGQNSIVLKIAPSELPATLKLTNHTSGNSLEKNVTANLASLSNLEAGLYELVLSNSTGTIRYNIFELFNCPPPQALFSSTYTEDTYTSIPWGYNELSTGSNSLGDNFKAEDGLRGELEDTWNMAFNQRKSGQAPVSSKTDHRCVNVYPNPAESQVETSFEFINLNDQDFEIQIVDGKGAVLHQDQFMPNEGHIVYKFSFPLPGTYLVRIISSDFETKHTVVVQ